MAKLVTGVFANRSAAMLAIEDLQRHGFAQDDLSLLASDTSAGREFYTSVNSKAPEGGVAGAVIGAVIGAILTALAASGHIHAHGLGLGLTGMTMVSAALVGVGAGGIIGLIIGVAIGAAIPEYESNLYSAERRRGGILLGVYTHMRRVGEVSKLIQASGGRDVKVKAVPDELLSHRQHELAK